MPIFYTLVITPFECWYDYGIANLCYLFFFCFIIAFIVMMNKNCSFLFTWFCYLYSGMSKPFRSIQVIPINKIPPFFSEQGKNTIISPLTIHPSMNVTNLANAVAIQVSFIHQFGGC